MNLLRLNSGALNGGRWSAFPAFASQPAALYRPHRRWSPLNGGAINGSRRVMTGLVDVQDSWIPRRRLVDPVDLRDTSAWPGYEAVDLIPRVYGRTRVKGIRYAAHGKTYVLADHPLAGVEAVYEGETPIAGWRHDNGADIAGHPVAFLYLAEVPQGEISADVRGLSGNPADILSHLYPRDDLQELAIACANADLLLGGALVERQTLRAALQFVVSQFGGVWSAGMPGFAILFPPPADAPLAATFGPLDVADARAETALDGLVTRLTITFDRDYASGQARQSLVLEADTTALYGVRQETLDLPWVKTARDALDIGTRRLEWVARPVWTLQWSAGVAYRQLQPGRWVEIDIGLPVTGPVMVTDVDPGYGSGTLQVVAQAPSGLVPLVTVVQTGTAFDAVV